MKKLLFLGGCLLVLASAPAKAQTTDPQIVIMEVYYTGGLNTGHIDISRGSGQVEKSTFSTRVSGVAVQEAIAKLYQQGYTLKTTFDPRPNNDSLSTLVFVKEK